MKKTTTISGNCEIIDILSDTSFKKKHIKGSKNFPVYEIAFKEKINKEYKNKNQSLCIYGWSDKTEEVQRAYKILTNEGYKNVKALKGGLLGYEKQGGKTVSSEKPIAQLEGEYKINLKNSQVIWTGRNIGSKHFGTVPIKRGILEFKKNKLNKGEIILDMKGIKNIDLDKKYQETLIDHLKSSDFFEVDKHPQARIELKSIKRISRIESKPNFLIKALLTIKKITHPVEFKAFIRQKEDKVYLNSHFDIDRTSWDVKYGSEKFFAKLGIHIVDDMVSMDVILEGMKKK